MRPTHLLVVLVTLVVSACASSAVAQPIGTFRWQQQPYCNVLTVNVVQTGAVYQLDGTDDQCGGAAPHASVVGLAFPNPNGTIGLGLTIVTAPGGTPLHLDATLNWPSVSGTWRDSTGTTGPFAFTPGAASPGSVRPAPRVSFPAGLSVGGTTITNVAPPVAATDASNRAYVDSATADVRTALVGSKVWSAYVSSSGAKISPGRYTSSTSGTGLYTVSFDLSGLGVPYHGFPAVVALPAVCTNGTVQVSSTLAVVGAGVLNAVTASFAVTTTAGAATNCALFTMLTPADPNPPGSPVPPLDTDGSAGSPSCTTNDGITTCVVGSPQQKKPAPR